jgi:hypothetical protein
MREEEHILEESLKKALVDEESVVLIKQVN